MPTFSRQNSTTSLSSYVAAGFSANGSFEPTSQWIESWLTELPLHTTLSLIDQIAQVLPSNLDMATAMGPTLRNIQSAQVRGIEPTPIRIHTFEWSPLSLGWYESLLWAFVFTSEMQVAKGTVGVWNGTMIKLFRVEQVAALGPTLSSPRGAVDAVGTNIVSRLGNIGLRGSSVPEQGGSGGGNTPPLARTGTGNSTARSPVL